MATRSERAGNGEKGNTVGSGSEGSTSPPEERIATSAEQDLEELEARLREAADRLTDTAKVLGSLATRQVQAHPMAAFGVAFLAGVTLARLLRH